MSGLRAAAAAKHSKAVDTPLMQTLAILLDEKETHPRRLTALHSLNGMFLDCDTHEKCLHVAASVPDKAILCSLGMVASGEPHAHLALDFLHFVSFREDKRSFLLQQDVVPLLVGLLKGGAEFELSRSSLSLLVSVCQDPRGADQLGNAPGVITLALKHIQHPQSDYRELWLKVIRCLLLNPAGRKQCVYREGVLQDLSAAAAALDGQQSEASYRKQLVSVAAEIRLYMTREQAQNGGGSAAAGD